MTTITIPLQEGVNYISFPATSTSNFLSIFTSSTILNNILNFKRFNPMLQDYEVVLFTDLIQKGVGYYIDVNIKSNIIYDGIEYTLIFDDIKSSLFRGWNLIGPGNTVIVQPNWCKIVDPVTDIPVTELDPMKAYWVSNDDCVEPTINIGDTIVYASSFLFLYWMVKELKII